MFERVRLPSHLSKLLVRPRAEHEPSPAESESPPKERRADWALASATSIAFSLTFFAGGLMLLFGAVPASIARVSPAIDLGVLVLIVPLCALTFAVVFEVLRAAVSGLPRVQPPRLAPALSDWRPGRGEG